MNPTNIHIMNRADAERAINDERYTACISIHNPFGGGMYPKGGGEPRSPIWTARPIKFLPLDFEDDLTDPRMIDIERTITFAKTLLPDDQVIVHCYQGRSRSSAIAIVLALALNDSALTLEQIVASFKERFPNISPNRAIVGFADEYFELDGKLIEVVETVEAEARLKQSEEFWKSIDDRLDDVQSQLDAI